MRRATANKVVVTLLLPLAGLVAWYYPLVESAVKPPLARSGIAKALDPDQTPANNTLAYPQLGIESPIVLLPQTSPLNTSDWESLRTALRQGIGISYEGESFEDSRLVFATGHSSDTYPHKYASVFASLNQAQGNDVITLVIDNKKHDFKVIESKIINPTHVNEFKALEPAEGSPKRLVMVTCWPVLTTKNRMVVVAEEI